jgi:phosphoribosylformimino-5-aminoimidazole carboxamide ribotide isomerase
VSFRIIPVIDLKGGMAVHAVGGRRDQYRPLRSIWQARPSPIALAAAMRDGLGIDRIYLADLDAIGGNAPDLGVYEAIIATGMTLWLDAGIRDLGRLGPLIGLDPRRTRLVVGLESVGGPADLERIIDRVGMERVIFSIDLDDGRARLASGAEWPGTKPHEIAGLAIDRGVREIILLDLARVGTGRGVGTVDLMLRMLEDHPRVAVSVGGGIRGIDDVLRMKEQGASAVLVGSAIHDGRIGHLELERVVEATG